MAILYTPIDIKVTLPNTDLINDWIDCNRVSDESYWAVQEDMHDWAFIASRDKNPIDWTKPDTFENWQETRQIPDENYTLTMAPGIKDIWPGVVDLLNALPFTQIGVAGFLRQKKQVPLHYDSPDITNPVEPRRYILYMTDPNECTFYLEKNGREYDICINPERPLIAFNSTEARHGAKAPKGNKIIMSVVGILDQHKHAELVHQSIKKYSDWVIISDLRD